MWSCPCWVACWEGFHQSRWKPAMTNSFWTERKSEWNLGKCWHGKRMTYFHTIRASRKKPPFVMTLEDKSLPTFLYWIAPMSIEKAWRPTWNYKTLLKFCRSETVATKQLLHRSSEASLCYSRVALTQILARIHVLSVRHWMTSGLLMCCTVQCVKLLPNQTSCLQKLCSFKDHIRKMLMKPL